MTSQSLLAAAAKIGVPVEETQQRHSQVHRKEVDEQDVETDTQDLDPEPLPGEVADDRQAHHENKAVRGSAGFRRRRGRSLASGRRSPGEHEQRRRRCRRPQILVAGRVRRGRRGAVRAPA